MKTLKILLPLFCLGLGTYAAVGQSSFVMQNVFLVPDAPVFDAAGTRLYGTYYVALLYGGATSDSLGPAFTATAPIATPAPFTFRVGGLAGYFFGGLVLVHSAGPGGCVGLAWLQVRAWDTRLGTTYEDVVKLGQGGYGESSLFQAMGGNACIAEPGLPQPLIGLQSFSLLPEVPEPGSLALLMFGLPVLLFLRCGARRSAKSSVG